MWLHNMKETSVESHRTPKSLVLADCCLVTERVLCPKVRTSFSASFLCVMVIQQSLFAFSFSKPSKSSPHWRTGRRSCSSPTLKGGPTKLCSRQQGSLPPTSTSRWHNGLPLCSFAVCCLPIVEHPRSSLLQLLQSRVVASGER